MSPLGKSRAAAHQPRRSDLCDLCDLWASSDLSDPSDPSDLSDVLDSASEPAAHNFDKLGNLDYFHLQTTTDVAEWQRIPILAMTAVPTGRAAYIFAEKLDLQNAEAGDFYLTYLRGLTHKLNNLLAVFQGFSSLLLMNESLDGSGRESVGHMKSAAQNGQGLSERILPAGGCARLTLQRVGLSEYLPMIDRALREPCQKLDVPFELRADPGLPPVEIDSARFKELLVELLKNAAEAVKENGGGEASMEIYGPGRSPEGSYDRVDVFVHNTGRIREDKVTEIFKPFVSTKDGSHFGLGLTVAAMLAHQMNMTLGAKCEGNRTTLWLSIPVAG